MIVLVTGGRDYQNARHLAAVLDKLHAAHTFTFLIHGDARGVDRMAAQWAMRAGVQPVAMPALWDAEGRSAGPKRNYRMYHFGKPRLVLAFPGGRGTANMMKVGYDAAKRGDNVEVIDIAEDYPE